MRLVSLLVFLLSLNAGAMMPRAVSEPEPHRRRRPTPQVFTWSPSSVHSYIHVIGMPTGPALGEHDSLQPTTNHYRSYLDKMIKYVQENEQHAIQVSEKLKKAQAQLTIEIKCRINPLDYIDWERPDLSFKKSTGLMISVFSHVFRTSLERFVEGQLEIEEENVARSSCKMFIRNFGSPHQDSLSVYEGK